MEDTSGHNIVLIKEYEDIFKLNNIINDKEIFSSNYEIQNYKDWKYNFIIKIEKFDHYKDYSLHIWNKEINKDNKKFLCLLYKLSNISVRLFYHIAYNKKYLKFHIVNINKIILKWFHGNIGNLFNHTKDKVFDNKNNVIEEGKIILRLYINSTISMNQHIFLFYNYHFDKKTPIDFKKTIKEIVLYQNTV